MIDTTNETRCKNPSCGKPIVHIPGHRRREYCNDTCKQTAYRIRKEQPHHDVTIADDSAQQRIAELEQELGKVNDLLERLIDKKQSKQPLRRSYQERLTRKLEQLGWPALEIRTTIKPGQKNGRVFILNASNDELIRAIIAAERLEEKQT